MGKELDRRDYTINRATEARKVTADASASVASEKLPGSETVRVASLSAVTGNPAAIASASAPAEKGNYVERAASHLNRLHAVMGFSATETPEFVPDDHAQETSSGAVAVHFQQRHKGIPIFQATQTVSFAPNGAILDTEGAAAPTGAGATVDPKITSEQAVQAAVKHCTTPDPEEDGKRDPYGVAHKSSYPDMSGYEPKMTTRFAASPQQHTVFEAGPFADAVKASLVWFDMGEDLRLTWEVLLSMPDYAAQYRTLVDAANGEILYCRQLVRHVLARGNVFRVDGAGARQLTDFPRPLADYDLPLTGLPNGFPDHWVSDNQTVGNSVRAHRDSNGPAVTGTMTGGVLTFNPNDPNGSEQLVVNLFYLNGVMHDFFYLLGFREADGNFQVNNLGRGGSAADGVDARVFAGEVQGTATMATPPDGLIPRMTMGLVGSTGRHSALDSGVVFHEFMHGVTNRLVGGPLNTSALEALQSSGMGEGWGDYIACSINNTEVVGDWLVNNPSGIRQFPYNSNFPDHFGKLGTGRFQGEEHNIGEIWCATLMELNRKIGKRLALQLVVDGLKLSPANPSFLDMRDAIFRALEDKRSAGQLSTAEHATALQGMREAFAKFGMGPGARSNGASLEGIVADFAVPVTNPVGSVQAGATPNLAIPDNQPAGVSSPVTVTDAGRLRRISVSVDIAHAFVGDLRVVLRAPGGQQAVLAAQSGGRGNGALVAAFTSEGLPALQALTGTAIQGVWTLLVSDVAAQDTGTLRAWKIELGVDAVGGQSVTLESAPGLAIPDNNGNGVSDTIAVTQAGTAKRVVVEVDITHTFTGDLQVELVAPDGQAARLHSPNGQDNRQNLQLTLDSTADAALAPVVNRPMQGSWTLRVRDLAAQDEGKLNRWSLQLHP